jgi:uncharacterized damage-inducible protein DinB
VEYAGYRQRAGGGLANVTYTTSPLPMLARYTAWANDLLCQALAELPDSELLKKQKIVFGSILRTLNHVCAMGLVWQAHLQGRRHEFVSRNPGMCPPFAELRAAQCVLDGWYVQYADDLGEAEMEMVDFEFIGGGSGRMSRSDIILHVINHATYHRGHIGDMIYQIPAHPPTTDLPVYLRNSSRARALQFP